MNEEPKVSKRIKQKLERYLNRERVEQRFDNGGQGLSRTHPLVVKLELAYLIANEDQKRKDREETRSKSPDGDSRQRRGNSTHHDVPIPRVKSLPQKKTRVQMSEIERLAKNAHTALKSIDADKISTVYRFRQQMIPYEVRHQGKVKQISTNVHAMLNAEEAWRYRKENDEREKVKKYKEQQKAKARALHAQEAKERELAKLPPGIRMEINRQQEKRSKTLVLEKLMEPSRSEASSPQHSVAMAMEDGYADGEENGYEDDFEEEEDYEKEKERRVGGSRGMENNDGGSEGIGKRQDAENKVGTDDASQVGEEDEALIAAVTTANNAGSVSSITPSAYTSASSRPQSMRSIRRDEAASAYDDDSFESENEEDADDGSVFMTDANLGSIGGSRSSSRAASPTKSSGKLRGDDFGVVEEEGRSVSEASYERDKPPTQVKHHSGDNPGSGEVKMLANQLARAVVKSAATEEGVSYSSTSSIRSERSNLTTQGDKQHRGKSMKREKTQEYTRTESIVSLSDRVKKD